MPLLPMLIVGVPVVIVLSILWVRSTGRRSGSGNSSDGYIPGVTDGSDHHHHSDHCGHDSSGADSGGDSGGDGSD